MTLITVKELSKIISIKESTLYAWASQALIPSYKLNGVLRFDIDEVEQWIKNSKIKYEPINLPQSNILEKKEIDGIFERAIASVKGKKYNEN